MNVSTKRLLSILLSLAMVLALLPMAVFAETAATLYVKPNENWLVDGARFAAYFFGNGDTWVDCTDADGDGYYEVAAPAGYPSVIFCRMNPKAAANNWNNKWNQTSDLKVPAADDAKVCYVVADGSWDKGNGQWVEYTPEGGAGETEPTKPNAFTYYVAGVSELCGVAWSENADANGMADEDGDGIYSITYSAVAAGTYQFKVTDGTWQNCWGGNGPDGNYEFTLTAEADVTINFKAEDKAIEVVSEGLKAPEVTEPTETEPFVPGVREYCLVGWINGADYGCEGDHENVGEYIFVDGKLSTSFKADSYVFLKTTDNTYWFMTKAYTEETTATFVTDASEKMKVPGNVELTFTLVENEDGSITLSYETGAEIPTEPTESTEPTEPVGTAYYVCGSFNEWALKDEAYLLKANEDGTYTVTFAVTKGTIELKVNNGTWDEGCSWGDNGNNVVVTAETDGEITVTFDGSNVTVTGSCLEEKVPEYLTINSMHVAGSEKLFGFEWDPAENRMDCAMGVYSITFTGVPAGTYEFKFAANGTWDLNWASGIKMPSGEVQTAWFKSMGNSSIEVTEDDSTVTLYFNMTTMDLVTGQDATTSAVIVGPTEAHTLAIGDNDLALAAGDQDGETYTFTATETGLLTLNVTALAYDWMGEGEYTEAPAGEIGGGWPRMYAMVVNGTTFNTLPVEIEVTEGDELTIQIYGYMAYATKLTLKLAMGGGSGDVPVEPGTPENPIVIESLPFEVTFDGKHDACYTYTAEADGDIRITRPAGNYVSGLPDYVSNDDGSYTVTVTAGQIVPINPWGDNAGT